MIDGKKLTDLLNKISYGIDIYAFEEGSNKVIAIKSSNSNSNVSIISLEKAQNELKLKTINMLEIIKEIFEFTTEDKAASNGISKE